MIIADCCIVVVPIEARYEHSMKQVKSQQYSDQSRFSLPDFLCAIDCVNDVQISSDIYCLIQEFNA